MMHKIAHQGYKHTKQRSLILKIIQSEKRLISAFEIYDKCLDEMPNMALSTIYRNLEILKKFNFVEETFIKENHTVLYQVIGDHHVHHMICLSCHKIFPMEHCHLEEISTDFEKKHGFLVESHKLEFYGYCKTCKNDVNSH